MYERTVKLFRTLFDVVFPPTEDESRVMRTESLPALFEYIETPAGLRVLVLSAYKRPEVAAAIKALKYHKNAHAALLCAELLYDALAEELSERALWGRADVLIVPMPLSQKRLRERGFNQIEYVLDVLQDEHGLDGARVTPDLLTRVKHTAPQTKLARRERLHNVAGAFAVREPARAKGARVMLVDDVVTTGATLAEAARILKEAGAREVLPVALARA